jgi:acetamidase/formamidase
MQTNRLLATGIFMAAAGALCVLGDEVVKYVPKHAELKYTFGGHRPVLALTPGTVLESWTEDCYDGLIQHPSDIPSKIIPANHDNPQTGPFFIKGAEPGDILAVHILDLKPARPYGISSSFPFFGALTATDYTAMLHDALPEKVWWYEVDRAKGTVRFKALKGSHTVDIPMRPFLGCLAVAPARGEVRWTVTPEAYGGNLDCPEVRAGNTIYLPVSVPGGLLYFGDGHLVQGDGEIISTAVEAALDVRLKVDLIKAKKLAWPRIESDEFLMAAGSYRPLEDAFRIAHKEMVEWLVEDFGLEMMDAYELLSQVGKAEIAQVVDPNYTVLAKFPKKYLPAGRAYGGIHDKLKTPLR